MTSHPSPRHALVFGASGLIGRHLIRELAQAGADVTAAVRTTDSGARVQRWLREHGLDDTISTTLVDFDDPQLVSADRSALGSVTEIHNCAGTYRFGMTAHEARTANVGIVERILDFAAGLPSLQRVVHVSGYRVGGQDPGSVPWTEQHREARYAQLGAYEASKVESDAVFQARARERGIAWTVVNPSSVIGHSATGECDQHIGLATSIEQVWSGAAAALPGNASTFLPVVTVDYLAAFMAAAAIDPAAAGRAYWVLDDDTPALPDLLGLVGEHLGAEVPRLRVPVALIKRLPARVTKADPETLSFLSSDRYPTAPAKELAERHGIEMPEVERSLERWADHLVAHRFGAAEAGGRRFVTAAGLRTFEVGEPGSTRVILPGLPVNADTWAPVAAGIGGRAVDLPGLGLSGGRGVADWAEWLPAILGEDRVHLVGHSIGAAAAVTMADLFPQRVSSLTLVAPFFLQAAGAWRPPRALVAAYLRHVSPHRLARRLTGSADSAAALESSVQDLRRGTARRVAEHLVLAGTPQWRRELREALARFAGPVRIITGGDDPLAPDVIEQCLPAVDVERVVVPQAGHHPQLTHEQALARMIRT